MNFSASLNFTAAVNNLSSNVTIRRTQPFVFKDYILMTLHVLIFVVGTVGNFLVWKFFTLETRGLSQIQRWMAYLAVTDFFMCVLDPIVYIEQVLTHGETDFGGIFGCKMVAVTIVLQTLSFSIVMVINIDRCIAILRPYRVKWSKLKTGLVLLFIIVLSLIFNLHLFISLHVNQHEVCTTHAEVLEFAITNIVSYVVRDLSFLVIFLVTILAIRHELSRSDDNMASRQSRKRRIKENRTVLKTLFMVSAAFIIFVYPKDLFHIIYQLSWMIHLNDGIETTQFLVDITSFLKFVQSLNSVCNVFIYAKVHQRFRKSVRSSFRRSFNMQKKARPPIQSKVKLTKSNSMELT